MNVWMMQSNRQTDATGQMIPAVFGSALVVICILLVGCGGVRADELPGNASTEIGAPAAKRVAPPDVGPVTVGDLRIEVLPWGKEHGFGQNGGYIVAFDARTGKELWTLEIYTIAHDPQLEADVQDRFIAKMSVEGGRLLITDEDGRNYRVDLATRIVTRL